MTSVVARGLRRNRATAATGERSQSGDPRCLERASLRSTLPLHRSSSATRHFRARLEMAVCRHEFTPYRWGEVTHSLPTGAAVCAASPRSLTTAGPSNTTRLRRARECPIWTASCWICCTHTTAAPQRLVRAPGRDAAGRDTAPGRAGGGELGGHRVARPREIALPQSVPLREIYERWIAKSKSGASTRWAT